MTIALFNPTPANSLRHYLTDVSNAARAFAEALFAAQGRQFVAQEVRDTVATTERSKAKGRRKMYALANEYQALAPGLAAELRSIAARD